jgi:hypothetical protein
LPMQDIHLRRFRIRYISLCQRLLPTRSLQRICFGEKKKRVSISTHLHQEPGRGEGMPASPKSDLCCSVGILLEKISLVFTIPPWQKYQNRRKNRSG